MTTLKPEMDELLDDQVVIKDPPPDLADQFPGIISDPEKPTKDTVAYRNFKPIEKPKYQGLHFRKLGNAIGRKGHLAFFSLQTIGGVGLAISGFLTGNEGRMATGILNTGRNFAGSAFEKGLGPLKKIDKDIGRGTLMTAAILSNLPQLIVAVTMPGITVAEIVASAAVVTAYTILATPAWAKTVKLTKDKIKKIAKNNNLFKGKEFKPNSIEVQKTIDVEVVDEAKAKTKPSLRKKFNSVASKSLKFSMVYVAPSLLFLRAGAQLVDGIIRTDIAAITAGAAFIIAPIALAVGNRYHNKLKTGKPKADTLHDFKEGLKNYPPLPLAPEATKKP